ncbi:hypothetical protein [Pectinatus haikarae]|uniref:Uncharacterized protein n=1 Tax=Pectinatus haikarae TaxID=349096 RepID=A0ABT9YAA1_9FIRM|nr:hypothetical protein [Pectinatus haikarae]MDQ0204420.1 hypothetical protein [Pectinatus haikarae]
MNRVLLQTRGNVLNRSLNDNLWRASVIIITVLIAKYDAADVKNDDMNMEKQWIA